MIGLSQQLIDRLRDHVTMLAEYIGERNVFQPQALRAAESYIKQVWQQGYQAVMVTDTAFYRYPYYHTSEDTPEKLDYASLTAVTSGLYKAISLIN